MTLDDFLRTLETLIDERETTDDDDDPGEGNFGCEACRKCNHCRFCIGCDSCEDCTYCDESIDCTSCTQSKRCVSCEKVSYCEDCRDCKGSRYLTLCVNCNDCVHCLACVGLEGAEFYVLNEKRTRKEYFALLRQVQELMRERMDVGWRPPGIGLAGEIDDPDLIMAGRNAELTAAPWLDPSPPAAAQRFARDPRRDELSSRRDDYGERERERPGVERRREPERSRWDVYPDEYPEYESPRRAREPHRDARELESSDAARRAGRAHEQPSQPLHPAHPAQPAHPAERPVPVSPAARSTGRPDVDARRPSVERQPPASMRARERDEDWDDRPVTREYDWEDSRERTVARPRRPGEREPAPPPLPSNELSSRRPAAEFEDDPLDEASPDEREREPSSPWIDEEAQAQARREAARGSLRRAGRPKRKPEGEAPRESTSSASYRTGSAPARTGDDSRTGTGLRLGRKPKR